MPKTKSITTRDQEIGRRIRVRRTLLQMSQTDLADKLGVTFQQVQKYEKATNRVAGGRLEDVAAALQCDVSYFYDDIKNADSATDVLKFLNTKDVIRLADAFSRILDKRQRGALVALAETMAARR